VNCGGFGGNVDFFRESFEVLYCLNWGKVCFCVKIELFG
jgi:hypothetical protein